MTVYNSTETYLGGVTVQKTAGQATYAPTGTAWKIPLMSSNPTNPRNFVYPPVTTAAVGPTAGSQGKKSPLVTIAFPLKVGFVDTGGTYYLNTLFNELLGGTLAYMDTSYNCSEFAIQFYEPIKGQRLFTKMKCMGLDLIYNAGGGPVMCQAIFCGIYGDSEDPGLPTVSNFSTAVGGQDYGTADVTITGADQVDGMTLSIIRAQGVQQTSNGTVYANAVTTGATGGTVTLAQSSTATLSAPTVFAVGATANHGFQIAFVTNLDSLSRPWALGRQTDTDANSLVDFSGATYANAYPYSITAL